MANKILQQDNQSVEQKDLIDKIIESATSPEQCVEGLPLLSAVIFLGEHVGQVESVINKHNIDVNAHYNKHDHKTPIFFAVLRNQVDIVKLLIKKGC